MLNLHGMKPIRHGRRFWWLLFWPCLTPLDGGPPAPPVSGSSAPSLIRPQAVTSTVPLPDAMPRTREQEHPLVQVVNPLRFRDEIEAFIQRDCIGPPPREEIIFVGSSSIRLWQLATSFPDLAALNRGFGGAHISDMLHYQEEILFKYQPRLVIFYCGENDIWAGKLPEQVLADFNTFTARLFACQPQVHLYVIPLKPSPLRQSKLPVFRELNHKLETICQTNENLHFIAAMFHTLLDETGLPRAECYAKDRLHLNENGYRRWTQILLPVIEQHRKNEFAKTSR